MRKFIRFTMTEEVNKFEFIKAIKRCYTDEMVADCFGMYITNTIEPITESENLSLEDAWNNGRIDYSIKDYGRYYLLSGTVIEEVETDNNDEIVDSCGYYWNDKEIINQALSQIKSYCGLDEDD